MTKVKTDTLANLADELEKQVKDIRKSRKALEAYIADPFPKAGIDCPKCGRPMTTAENTYNGLVFQRVISCDWDGYVHNFDDTLSDDYWEAQLKHE